MSGINYDSILKKAQAYMQRPEAKKKIEKMRDDALQHGQISNGRVIHSAVEAGEKFGQVLRKTIQSSGIPANVIIALEDYDVSHPHKLGDGKYHVMVFFDNDTKRETMSTKKAYYSIDLAELYNDGVDHIMKPIYEWDEAGGFHKSLTHIPGAHFMEQAVNDFMNNYAAEYNVLDIKINRNNR